MRSLIYRSPLGSAAISCVCVCTGFLILLYTAQSVFATSWCKYTGSIRPHLLASALIIAYKGLSTYKHLTTTGFPT